MAVFAADLLSISIFIVTLFCVFELTCSKEMCEMIMASQHGITCSVLKSSQKQRKRQVSPALTTRC